MPCHSQDLKACIPILFYEQCLTIKDICKILGVQKTLAYSSLIYFQTYGIATNLHVYHKTGCQCLLNSADSNVVLSLVLCRRDLDLEHESMVDCSLILVFVVCF